MPRTSVKIQFDKKRAAAMIREASDDALTIMGNQALKDASQYVPKDQHTLENRGLTNSDQKAQDGIYRLVWSTPYAQYLWHGDVMHGKPDTRTYGPDKLTFTAALAREEWAKYAYEVHGKECEKIYQKAFKGGISQ